MHRPLRVSQSWNPPDTRAVMSDTIVVGAGIAGLLSAKALLEAGMGVTLLDRQEAGKESSWAGGGILSPLMPWDMPEPVMKLSRRSQAQYPELAALLLQYGHGDVEWQRCGLLVLAVNDTAAASQWCQSASEAHVWMDASAAATLGGGLHIPGAMADAQTEETPHLWLPMVAQVRNPRLLQSLEKAVIQLGGRVLKHTEVQSWQESGSRLSAIITNHGSMEADHFVLTCGAWSGQLLGRCRPAFPALPVEPVKGQMLAFQAEPGVLPCMVIQDGHYLIPRNDGVILAGSTVEYCGFDKTTQDNTRTTLSAFMHALRPDLCEAPLIAHWAGLRPGSPAGIPYIGQLPGLDNVWCNTGHFRNGLVMGPASAELLADLLLGRPTQLDPTPYAPSRPY